MRRIEIWLVYDDRKVINRLRKHESIRGRNEIHDMATRQKTKYEKVNSDLHKALKKQHTKSNKQKGNKRRNENLTNIDSKFRIGY